MNSKLTKFESLLEAVRGALVGMDPLGGIRFVNHRAELLFGYDRDDLIGRHIDLLLPESLWHVYLAHRDDYFADPRTRSMGLDLELRGRCKDGALVPVEVSLSSIDTGDVLLVITAVSDVISTKKAYENAQRMAAIVEHSDDAIIAKTLDGRITTWNAAAQNMYGYTSLEIIGRSASLLVPQDRAGETGAILDGLETGRSVEHFETVRVRKDGTSIHVSISESPIRDEDGVVVGVSTIARDVSERINAFQEARAMIESSQDSLVALSPEGTITDANEATAKATGVPRDELIGTAFADYFTDPAKADQIYHMVFDQGVAADYPLTIRHRDGTLTDVLYNASVHRGVRGRVLAVFAAARDVTKLRQAFEAARAMIESSQDSLVSISAEGKITDVNEATVRVTGVPREELIGTAFPDYFTDPAKANRVYHMVLDKGMAANYPLVIRHRDGTLTDVLYNASVHRDPNGRVLGVFAAARDVTQQRRAQRELAEQLTAGLQHLTELEVFQRRTVGRELQMIELNKEIEYLRGLIQAEEIDAAERR